MLAEESGTTSHPVCAVLLICFVLFFCFEMLAVPDTLSAWHCPQNRDGPVISVLPVAVQCSLQPVCFGSHVVRFHCLK